MIEMHLNSGLIALVDEDDYPLLSMIKWHASKDHNTYYARGKDNKGNPVSMHRMIMVVSDPSILIDHKDGNGLNNQKSNLRTCDHGENLRNSRKQKNCTSIFKGVYYEADRKKWKVSIKTQHKSHTFGRFETEIEAAIKYNEVIESLVGEFGRPNVIPDGYIGKENDIKPFKWKESGRKNMSLSQKIRYNNQPEKSLAQVKTWYKEEGGVIA